MEVRALIQRCRGSDSAAWEELWPLLSSAANDPTRRLLKRNDLDASLAEDILQDLYIHWKGSELSLLGDFHGTGEAKFRQFLRSSALYFGRNWIRKWKKGQRREVRALTRLKPTDRSCSTEQQILSRIREVESLMDEDDRRKLAFVSNVVSAHSAEQPPSPRTLRRWQRYLCKKYSGKLI